MARTFAWLSRDERTLYATCSLRSFSYGLLSVVLGLYMGRLGMSAFQAGALLAAIRFGGAAVTLAVTLFGDRFGRRRTLVVISALSAAGGVAFALDDSFWWMAVAAALGNFSAGPRDRGAFSSVEQSTLASATREENRTKSFGYYNGFAAAASAIGSLAAGAPALLALWFDMDEIHGMRLMFVAYAVLSAAAGALYLLLTTAVEVENPRRHGLAVPPGSRGIILRLTGLLAFDTFSGTIALASFIAYWFSVRWGVDTTLMAAVFFGTNVLMAVSQVAAARIAVRFGLMNTIFWTQLPASLLIIAVAFAPTAALAVALYLLRETLSQMDNPTRQSYVVAVVPPEDRTAVTGFTTIARNSVASVSPLLGGVLATLTLGAPLVISGVLKIGASVLMYAALRRTLPPEEAKARAAREAR